jgi:hypothetical protein
MVPYWVGQSPSQGMFLKKTLSRPCSEYEVDGIRNFGHGVRNISRAHIVSFMGTFVEGVLQPFVYKCNIFRSPLFAFHFLWFEH